MWRKVKSAIFSGTGLLNKVEAFCMLSLKRYKSDFFLTLEFKVPHFFSFLFLITSAYFPVLRNIISALCLPCSNSICGFKKGKNLTTLAKQLPAGGCTSGYSQLWVPSTLNPASSSAKRQSRESPLFPSTWNKHSEFWSRPYSIPFTFEEINTETTIWSVHEWKRLVWICYLAIPCTFCSNNRWQVPATHDTHYALCDSQQPRCLPAHSVTIPVSQAERRSRRFTGPFPLSIGALLRCPAVPWAVQANQGHYNKINYSEHFFCARAQIAKSFPTVVWAYNSYGFQGAQCSCGIKVEFTCCWDLTESVISPVHPRCRTLQHWPSLRWALAVLGAIRGRVEERKIIIFIIKNGSSRTAFIH